VSCWNAVAELQSNQAICSLRSNGVIAGWGARSLASEAQSRTLQWIRLPFVDISQCAAFYANYTASFRSRIMISNSQFCIQGREMAGENELSHVESRQIKLTSFFSI